MKYFLLIVQNNNVCAAYKYDTYSDALAALHSELAYRGEDRTSTICVIVDSNSNVNKSEIWVRDEDPELNA